MRTFMRAAPLALIGLLFVAGCADDSPEAEFARQVSQAIEDYGATVDLDPAELLAEADKACQAATADIYAESSGLGREVAAAIFDSAHNAGICDGS